jgi:hypothetical protein
MEAKWVAAFFLGIAGAGKVYAGDHIPVHVYLQGGVPSDALGVAQRIAADMFSRVGVRLIWHSGDLPETAGSGPRRIGIRIVKQVPQTATEFALAGAQPYASTGTLIQVYEDRVKSIVSRQPSLSRELLGYVFAHELGHVLMGTNYHSDSGVMKAQWSNDDYAAMRMRRLRFNDSDSDRIREVSSPDHRGN